MAPASFLPLSNTVCVMDASGHLGHTLVERLLQRGYFVHAAIQTQGEGAEKLKGMGEMESWKQRLKVFKSDPFDYQTIVDALRGCSALIYTFEPPIDQPSYDEPPKAHLINVGGLIPVASLLNSRFLERNKHRLMYAEQEQMIEVEVRAAHNVLEACAHVDTIDKVVFTSSATAVIWRDDRKSMECDLDERNWSDVNFCRKCKLWHALSKTLAEKSAWALARDREINMVSINAGLPLTPDVSISHPYLQGAAEMYEDGVFVTVDLDFLVDAQICVLEDISTYGRYLCFNNVINRAEDAFILAKRLTPSSPLDPQSFQDGEKLIQQRISNKKMNKLMVDFADQLS